MRLHPHVTAADLALLEEHSKARKGNPADLTFGENVRLLERDEIWKRLDVNIDKKEFLKRLNRIRDIRNEVMHFGPRPLDVETQQELNEMENFVRHVFDLPFPDDPKVITGAG